MNIGESFLCQQSQLAQFSSDLANRYLNSVSSGRVPVRSDKEPVIEKAGEVDVTASAVVGAVQAYAKINAAGEWIDRSETISLNQLFDRMSTQELEAYAQTGALPDWFEGTIGATTEEGTKRRLILDT